MTSLSKLQAQLRKELDREKPDVNEVNRLTTEINLVKVVESGCDVCGSSDVTEAPHMGKNCNRCNAL